VLNRYRPEVLFKWEYATVHSNETAKQMNDKQIDSCESEDIGANLMPHCGRCVITSNDFLKFPGYKSTESYLLEP